jgi:uncharacterized membrane protein YfcA
MTVRFVVIGLVSGIAAGFFGIGGGILVVPGLIYWAGFTQHRATGTSLAVLLPPIGIAAAVEYYRNGNVDVRAAIVIAVAMIVGGGVGAYMANKLPGPWLRRRSASSWSAWASISSTAPRGGWGGSGS